MQVKPLVGVVMGSKSDYDVLSAAVEILRALEIPHEARVVSAHRTPDRLFEYAETARKRGLRVEADLRNEKISYKVREHSLAKIPALVVVGRKEAAERTVSIRRLGSNEQTAMDLGEALDALVAEATPPDLRPAPGSPHAQ